MGARAEKKTESSASNSEDDENQTVDWSEIFHIFGFKYGFNKKEVLSLTRKQVNLHFEHLKVQNESDLALQAKLHGFKMSVPLADQKWSAEEDKKLTEMAQKAFEQMQKRAEELKGST